MCVLLLLRLIFSKEDRLLGYTFSSFALLSISRASSNFVDGLCLSFSVVMFEEHQLVTYD